MKKISILICLICFYSNSFGESIFVLGEPYYRGNTDYVEENECQEAHECIEFVWFREYRIKNIEVLSGNIKPRKMSFVMATHTPRYTNGDRRQKWYLELVPVTVHGAEYKAIDWYPVTEMICTKKPLLDDSGTLKSLYKSRYDEPCYDIADLIGSGKISNNRNQPTR